MGSFGIINENTEKSKQVFILCRVKFWDIESHLEHNY